MRARIEGFLIMVKIKNRETGTPAHWSQLLWSKCGFVIGLILLLPPCTCTTYFGALLSQGPRTTVPLAPPQAGPGSYLWSYFHLFRSCSGCLPPQNNATSDWVWSSGEINHFHFSLNTSRSPHMPSCSKKKTLKLPWFNLSCMGSREDLSFFLLCCGCCLIDFHSTQVSWNMTRAKCVAD